MNFTRFNVSIWLNCLFSGMILPLSYHTESSGSKTSANSVGTRTTLSRNSAVSECSGSPSDLSLLRGRNTPFPRCGKRSYAQTHNHLALATTNIITHWCAPMCTRRLLVALIIRLALSMILLLARCRLPILPLLYKRILYFRLYHIWVQYLS